MGAESLTNPSAIFAGKYRLLRTLGKGAMGEVWLADEEGPRNFKRRVAVKRLLAASELGEIATESFVAEAQVIARLDHPNIVRLIELGSAEGALYLVLEFVDGAALDKMLKRGSLSPIAVAFIGREVARALEAVHSMCDDEGKSYGVVHRDVSPSNILIGRDARVRLSDFGVARISGLGGDKTETGVFKGKLPYMPPEQARGEAFDGRADVFSLAITLYEALLGKRLRRAETQSQLLMKIAHESLPPLSSMVPSAPPVLARTIDRALSLNPEERTADAHAFAAELDEALRALGRDPEQSARDELRERVLATVEGSPASKTPSVSTPEKPWAVVLTKSDATTMVDSDSGEKVTVPAPARSSSPSSPSEPSRSGPRPITSAPPTAQSPVAAAPIPSTPPSLSAVAASGAPPARLRPILFIAAAALVATVALLMIFVGHAKHEGDATSSSSAPTVASSPTTIATATVIEPIAKVETSAATEEPRATATASAETRTLGPRTNVHAPTATPATAVEETSGPGTLQVVVLPWADVSIDGKGAGTTPIAPVSLPPGAHTVVLRNSELGASRTVGVTVKAGKPTLLRVDLRRND